MKDKLTNEDLIRKFIDKELSDEEKKAFGNRYNRDPLFVKEVNLNLDILTGLKSKRDKEGVKINPYRKYLLIAASIVFVLLFPSYFLFRNYSLDEIIQQEIILESEMQRNAVNNIEAVEKYNEQNFEQAIILFKKLPSYDENPDFQFYVGTAYLALEESEKAKLVFENMLNDLTYRIIEAKYCIAISYLQNGEKEEAIKLINEILLNLDSSSSYHRGASKLKTKVESFWWDVFN